MKRREIVATIAAVAAARAASPTERFNGVWKLIRFERRSASGEIALPYGNQAIGRLIYDRAGRMSVQFMRPGRHSTVPPGSVGLGAVEAEEIREAVDGFTAYLGRFEIDESRSTVTHHVQVCLIPSWVGIDQKRAYRFEGNRLILTGIIGSNTVELIWEREPE